MNFFREDLSKVREKVEEFLKEEKFDEATDVLVSSSMYFMTFCFMKQLFFHTFAIIF